jgi:hypothetical protein
MSRDEHLDRIVADCRDMLRRGKLVSWNSYSEAGWRVTIAAIESCREIRSPDTGEVLDAIVAAWPEELL